MGTLPSMRRYGQGCALVAFAFLTAESRLQAYIDLGATGLFVQGLIGAIAAVIVLTRSWRQRILCGLPARYPDSAEFRLVINGESRWTPHECRRMRTPDEPAVFRSPAKASPQAVSRRDGIAKLHRVGIRSAHYPPIPCPRLPITVL